MMEKVLIEFHLQLNLFFEHFYFSLLINNCNHQKEVQSPIRITLNKNILQLIKMNCN